MSVPTRYDVHSLYQEWLKGSSLRYLAQQVGIPHGSLHTSFRKAYGRNACSLQSKSLVRSIIADYENKPEVIKWALSQCNQEEDKYFKSKHSLQQLSNFQTLREEYILNQVEAPEEGLEDNTWGFLRVELYQLTLDVVQDAIAQAIRYTQQTELLEYAA